MQPHSQARLHQGGLLFFKPFRWLLLLLLAPSLLAPIYYQGGRAVPVGEPTQTKAADLPPAAALESPLLITPTFAPEPEAPSPSTPPPNTESLPALPAPKPLGVANPAACAEGLGVLQDMAALAYQRETRQVYMGVLVAAGLARQQVLEGTTPNLAGLRKRLFALPRGALLRDDLMAIGALIDIPCQNAAGDKTVEKPTIPRPR